MAVIEEAILLREAARDHLAELAVTGDNSCAQVGATKAMLDADRDRLELMVAMGRLPRNLQRFQAETDFLEISKELIEVLRKRGVSEAVTREFREVVARHIQHRPKAARNGKPGVRC